MNVAIDWIGVFDAVCRRSDGALEWGLPEPWIHAELYDRPGSRCGAKAALRCRATRDGLLYDERLN